MFRLHERRQSHLPDPAFHNLRASKIRRSTFLNDIKYAYRLVCGLKTSGMFPSGRWYVATSGRAPPAASKPISM